MKAIVKAAVFMVVMGAVYATPSFTLSPAGGTVGGEAGTTVGWGFTIVNDTANYLWVDSSNFCELGGDPQFSDCTTPPPIGTGPTMGTYTDYIATNLTVVQPGATLSQGFNGPGMLGVGGYTINPGAAFGMTDVGNVFISYQQYQGNPFAGGTEVAGDTEAFAAAEVLVTPEPATFGYGLIALAIAGIARRRSQRS